MRWDGAGGFLLPELKSSIISFLDCSYCLLDSSCCLFDSSSCRLLDSSIHSPTLFNSSSFKSSCALLNCSARLSDRSSNSPSILNSSSCPLFNSLNSLCVFSFPRCVLSWQVNEPCIPCFASAIISELKWSMSVYSGSFIGTWLNNGQLLSLT